MYTHALANTHVNIVDYKDQSMPYKVVKETY